ncbi:MULTISPECIES: hypothetical protein [Campylobacter]|uniref:DsbI-accessory protein Dba n=2 Tax=Campylobacter TaxID=194 RepID=A0ABT7HSI8_9BACT|nr:MULTISPECIES: hypothetical protein [Campylobacter]MDL0089809.1 hypothetical protein [Campylobacter gastrosuis]MDL0089845.1 hypothetical protein [Campylobacter gastrosuis]QCD43899.1 putative membrane protein [Campylobacter mucosalis CCUG 21559]QKF62249.1 putative membrane protein [Campylobacter mucosalis]
MEFLQLVLFFISALVMYIRPEKKGVAVSCAIVGCALLVVLEFYVNLWVVMPIGNL